MKISHLKQKQITTNNLNKVYTQRQDTLLICKVLKSGRFNRSVVTDIPNKFAAFQA
jgi:hypothetical protein